MINKRRTVLIYLVCLMLLSCFHVYKRFCLQLLDSLVCFASFIFYIKTINDTSKSLNYFHVLFVCCIKSTLWLNSSWNWLAIWMLWLHMIGGTGLVPIKWYLKQAFEITLHGKCRNLFVIISCLQSYRENKQFLTKSSLKLLAATLDDLRSSSNMAAKNRKTSFPLKFLVNVIELEEGFGRV